MLSRSFTVVALFALLICIVDIGVEAKERPEKQERRKLKDAPGLSRDRIVENHKRRRAQLAKLLEEAKDNVADHESGSNLLQDEQYELFSKRIGLYERKLEKMAEEPDEREIERMLDREQMRAERYHSEF